MNIESNTVEISIQPAMVGLQYVSCINSECCCKCINLKKIMCHPLNQNIGNGEVSKQLGFVCVASLHETFKSDSCYFFENEHGCCELFIKK